jgi:Glycosyltransferase family 87
VFPVRKIGAYIILVAAAAVVVAGMAKPAAHVTDFTAFWIAGQRLIAHGNPYDATYALTVERSLAFTGQRPLVMRNPPWALWMTLPLGLLPLGAARLLWTGVLVAVLFGSALLVWKAYGGASRRRCIAILITFTFGPTLACVAIGQTAPFVLLGLGLFLLLHDRHEFWAGSALLLSALKPQVGFLFWLALLLWIAGNRKWKIGASFLCTVMAATLIALWFDPEVMRQYRAMLLSESLQTQFLPTLSGLLRQTFGVAWLQIVPAILGMLLTIVLYRRYRESWAWSHGLPILLLASLLLTPYAWLADEVVLLIPIIAAATAIRILSAAAGLIVLFVTTNIIIVALLVSGVRVNGPYYLWTPVVWCVFYVASFGVTRRCEAQAKVGQAHS